MQPAMTTPRKMTGTARFSVESRDTSEGDVKRLSLLGTLAIVLLLGSLSWFHG